MNPKLFLAASFSFLSLAACGPQDSFSGFFDAQSFFLTEIEVIDLDGDGAEDDSVTSFTLFVSEEKDACDTFGELGFGLEDFFPSASIVQVRQQHLNATNVPFVEGDITGGPLFDDQGTPIDGAASVTSFFKSGGGRDQQFSAGLGDFRFEKIRERSVDVSSVDEFTLGLRVEPDGEISIVSISEPAEGQIKRAKRCEALSALGIIGLD